MENQQYSIINVDAGNIDKEHICCAIGNDKKNCERAKVKKEWLKERFPEGHTFKKVDVRGKVFIEYVPAEFAWFPVIAPGYMFIQCFWASGRYQGQGLGKKLLEECETDSRNLKKNGLIVISTSKKQAFTADKKFFLKRGYQVCDTANPGFELLLKRFNKDAPTPAFTQKAKLAKLQNKKGLTFYYSEICPFVPDFLMEMIKCAQKREIPCDVIKIENLQQAKDLPTAFGIFSVFYNNDFLTQEIMTEKKFNTLLEKTIK